MGIFNSWYTKEGKGVNPDDPPKRGFFRFMDIFFRKFWRFVRLNLIYILFCIPTFLVVFILSGIVSDNLLGTLKTGTDADMFQGMVMLDILLRFVVSIMFTALWGMGPATAGFTYVLRNFSREEHAWVWSDFLEHTRKNFKQSIALWLIDIVVFYLCIVAIIFYASKGGYFFILQYLMIMIMIIYTMMHFYIYPMMVTFRLTLKEMFRNAAIFALGKLPSNIGVLALLLGIHLGLSYIAVMCTGGYMAIGILVLAILYLFILYSLSGFIVNFAVYPKLKQYMILDETVKVRSDASDEDGITAEENDGEQ